MASIGKNMLKLLENNPKLNLMDMQRVRIKLAIRRNTKNNHTFSEEDKCVRCGSKENLTRHHKNYSNWKNFIIICRECHNIEDKEKEIWKRKK